LPRHQQRHERTHYDVCEGNTDIVVTEGVGGAGVGLKEVAMTVGDRQALLKEVVWMHSNLHKQTQSQT
jgi:hypothetical protein